jgi:hypothetical protein
MIWGVGVCVCGAQQRLAHSPGLVNQKGLSNIAIIYY